MGLQHNSVQPTVVYNQFFFNTGGSVGQTRCRQQQLLAALLSHHSRNWGCEPDGAKEIPSIENSGHDQERRACTYLHLVIFSYITAKPPKSNTCLVGFFFKPCFINQLQMSNSQERATFLFGFCLSGITVSSNAAASSAQSSMLQGSSWHEGLANFSSVSVPSSSNCSRNHWSYQTF